MPHGVSGDLFTYPLFYYYQNRVDVKSRYRYLIAKV